MEFFSVEDILENYEFLIVGRYKWHQNQTYFLVWLWDFIEFMMAGDYLAGLLFFGFGMVLSA